MTRKETQTIFLHIINLQDDFQARIYTNQTGKFPVHLNQGNQYLIILCKMNSDSTLMEPLRDKTAEEEMVKTYQKMTDRLHACGIYPKHQVLNNKIPEAYKVAIRSNKMVFQQVLAHDHRRNNAEKGIQSTNDNLVSVFCGVDAKSPMHIWDLCIK